MANKIVPQTLNSSGVYDKLITAISSGGTGAESESAAVKNLINGLSSTTPDSNDLIPFQDVSSGGAGKTTLSALASTLQSVRGYAKIQTGSYVGTGTYGEANPCSLTFASKPFLLIMYSWTYPYSQWGNDYGCSNIMYAFKLDENYQDTYSFGIRFSCHARYNNCKLQWYQGGGSDRQYNSKDTIYQWVAFC